MKIICILLCAFIPAVPVVAEHGFETDTFQISDGTLKITFIGHATLMLQYNEMIIHVDPVSREADYSKMPKADLILITHDHGDHFDVEAIQKIHTGKTTFVVNPEVGKKIKGETIDMKNGDVKTVLGLKIEAVPAYNITEGRSKYHPKGRDNGYILTIGGKRIYIAGDTEDTPEVRQLRDIDIAFLPMNQPYTMTPQQVAEAARAFRPAILYPYHYGDTDVLELVKLLKGENDIEVRIRKLP
jgi:L-ascorbate metabolism protein UlaG (beta-lactamase superfamily)